MSQISFKQCLSHEKIVRKSRYWNECLRQIAKMVWWCNLPTFKIKGDELVQAWVVPRCGFRFRFFCACEPGNCIQYSHTEKFDPSPPGTTSSAWWTGGAISDMLLGFGKWRGYAVPSSRYWLGILGHVGWNHIFLFPFPTHPHVTRCFFVLFCFG